MKWLCAWCNRHMVIDGKEPKDMVTHGICPSCKKKLLAGEFEDLKPQPEEPERFKMMDAADLVYGY